MREEPMIVSAIVTVILLQHKGTTAEDIHQGLVRIRQRRRSSMTAPCTRCMAQYTCVLCAACTELLKPTIETDKIEEISLNAPGFSRIYFRKEATGMSGIVHRPRAGVMHACSCRCDG
jgi:hypothetical protein